jgi:hypothetical protein
VNAGTRVAFPARRGGLPVTCTGTVVPSRLVRWTRVRVDDTAAPTVIDVRTENLRMLGA